MAGYCMSVRPYFHELQASEITAQDDEQSSVMKEWNIG